MIPAVIPPLTGLTVLVTRPAAQAQILADRIRTLGGDAWLLPAIEIKPRATSVVGVYDLIVCVSINAVDNNPDNVASIQDGWNDAQGSENADKCAWTNDQNITLGGRPYAVQPMWSNEAFDATGNGCVMAR